MSEEYPDVDRTNKEVTCPKALQAYPLTQLSDFAYNIGMKPPPDSEKNKGGRGGVDKMVASNESTKTMTKRLFIGCSEGAEKVAGLHGESARFDACCGRTGRSPFTPSAQTTDEKKPPLRGGSFVSLSLRLGLGTSHGIHWRFSMLLIFARPCNVIFPSRMTISQLRIAVYALNLSVNTLTEITFYKNKPPYGLDIPKLSRFRLLRLKFWVNMPSLARQ